MEGLRNKYILLLSEIIAKESIVLGSDMAISKAKSIGGLVLDKNGNVINIKGDPNSILNSLINEYVDIAGDVAKEAIAPIFEKYPLIKI